MKIKKSNCCSMLKRYNPYALHYIYPYIIHTGRLGNGAALVIRGQNLALPYTSFINFDEVFNLSFFRYKMGIIVIPASWGWHKN